VNHTARIRLVGQHRPIETVATGLRVDAWVLAAMGVAIALRAVRLDVAPLWLDEVVSAMWVDLPWGDAMRAAIVDRHPPLYVLLLKSWVLVAGHSDWALRAFSVIASCIAVMLTAALARLMAGAVAARWAAWLAALSPYVVHHAQEARMYALVMALAALHLLLFVGFVLGRRERLGWGFALTAVALTATHYYAAFLVCGEILSFALLMPLRRLRGSILSVGVAAAAVASLALTAAAFAAHRLPVSEYDLGMMVAPGAIWALIGGYELMPRPEALHTEGLAAVWAFVPVAAVAGAALAATAWGGLRSLTPAMRTVALATAGTVVAGPLAAQMVAGVGFHPRYLAAAMPLFIVVLAAGAPPRLTWNAPSLCPLVLVATMLLGTAIHLHDPSHGREDVRAVQRWLDDHVARDEEILVTSHEMEILARHHWPQRRLRRYPEGNTVVADEAGAAVVAERLPLSADGRAIYVFGRAWLSDPAGALRRALRQRYRPCDGTQARGIEVLCVDAAGPRAGDA
jgi:hypothetical protein